MTEEYKIVERVDVDALTTEINELMNSGWWCVGGVSVIPNGNNRFNYIQAVARNVEGE